MGSNGGTLTLLDRSLRIVLSEGGVRPDDTPSRRHGITARIERLHRLHGTSLLASAWRQWMEDDPTADPLGTSCYGTSCVLFHRYLHRVPLTETDVWSVAMASALLASKLHDRVRVTPSTIVQTFAELYHERVLLLGCDTEGGIRKRVAAHPSVSTVLAFQDVRSDESHDDAYRQQDYREIVKASVSAMSRSGPVYQEWIKAVIETESDLLRQLGFVVHWIPDHLAHKYLPHFLDLFWERSDLKLNKEEVAQRSWNYCNDSYRLDLSTRFHPSSVAIAAIHLSILDVVKGTDTEHSFGANNPLAVSNETTIEGSQGNEALSNADEEDNLRAEISLVGNALLGLQDCFDVTISDLGFVSSVSGRAFNDPKSILWGHLRDQLQKQTDSRWRKLRVASSSALLAQIFFGVVSLGSYRGPLSR